MSNHVLQPADLLLIAKWKQRHGLVPIVEATATRDPLMILVLCPSGRQLQDRMNFYWKVVADVVHPITTHGGAIRLSSYGNFFDPSVFRGVVKASRVFPKASFGVEGHFPCADGCARRLGLEATMFHTLVGHESYEARFGSAQAFFHIDYTCVSGKDGRMETFAINPTAMRRLVSTA